MPYKIGDLVSIKPLNREGTILEVLADGSYRVSLGLLPIVVKEADIALASGKKKPLPQVKNKVTVQSSAKHGKEKEELDLHGKTVAEAVALLEEKINRAIIAKLHRIQVVHGIGSGRVRDGVHDYLSQSTLISAFKSDQFNPGVTWVYL